MHYILFITLSVSHWFGPDTQTITTTIFNTESACTAVKTELNSEFHTFQVLGRAECAPQGEAP